MADIPNRNTVFPTWELIQRNLTTRIAKVNTVLTSEGKDVGRTEVASRIGTPNEIVGVPTDIGSDLMKLIGLDVPVELYDDHNLVEVNGSEYPEQITATVPAGKMMTINAGQRWLHMNDAAAAAGRLVFEKEYPDDAVFAKVETGATLNLNLDKSDNNAAEPVIRAVNLIDPAAPTADKDKYVAYALGGRNVASIEGTGTVRIDGGKYGNNFFVEATKSTTTMGDGKGYYLAHGISTQGHKVTGGKLPDVFEYNFASKGMPTKIGTNVFEAGEGSTASGAADSIQLRSLPAGSKVSVQVTSLKTTGALPDANMIITIKNPQGTTIGTIEGKDVNYLHMIYADGTSQGVAPKTIGVATKEYTIGTTAPKAAASNKFYDFVYNEPTVSPVNLEIPKATKDLSRNS